MTNPDDVLKSIEKAAPSQGLPIIGPRRGTILDDLVKEHKPSRVLEVGTLVGYSAIRIARHLARGGKMTCVEVNGEMAKVARSNIEKAGLSEKVEVIVGDGKRVVASLTGSFDMVFLDAAKGEYLAYLKGCEKLLHRGSVVIADNAKLHAGEMADYLSYVRSSGLYRSSYLESTSNFGTDPADAVEVSVRL